MVIYSTIIIKTAWDLDDKSFIFVVAVALESAPLYKRLYISLGLRTAHSERPSTKTPFFLSSLIWRLDRSTFNRSEMTSL